MSSKYIGDRRFYKRVLALALPVMAQNSVTHFVNMLDNIMIGRVGTLEMSGTAVANELIFVFFMLNYGAVSGIGIFGAQFAGVEDEKGMRYVLRLKLIFTAVLCAAFAAICFLFGDGLIGLFLRGEGSASDAAMIFGYAKQYLRIILIGILPHAAALSYGSSLRETGETVVPMAAGLAAVATNLVFNYLLIFGCGPIPAMGVAGAACATVISRYVEAAIVILYSHMKRQRFTFVKNLYKSFYVPGTLICRMLPKGLPLMLNELIWAGSLAMMSQCYSLRGLSVVAAINIVRTFWNLFEVGGIAMGTAVGVLLGQMLGRGEMEAAKRYSLWGIGFSVFSGVLFAGIMVITAQLIPTFYNVGPDVQQMAMRIMRIGAISIVCDSVINICYFSVRSGGSMLITMLSDSCFQLLIQVPLAFCLSRYTEVNIYWLYGIVQNLMIVKTVIGIWVVNQNFWLRTLIKENENVS